jgi:Na+-driven multidrug efflux pump
VLAFPFGWGALGIWIGLCVGLMIIGPVLLIAWHGKVLRAPVRGSELMDVA